MEKIFVKNKKFYDIINLYKIRGEEMNRKRLLTTSMIAIILVSILFIRNTYSVFVSTAPDEEINVYKTGNLNIEVTGDDKAIDNIHPTNEKESNQLEPYHITVKNNGTVPYKFNIKLDETTSNNGINHKYIITKVGTLKAKTLEECPSNILKSDIIIEPNETIDIDIRVWISDLVPNTEMNKSFYAKLKIEGEATQNKNTNIDNQTLISPKEETKEQKD